MLRVQYVFQTGFGAMGSGCQRCKTLTCCAVTKIGPIEHPRKSAGYGAIYGRMPLDETGGNRFMERQRNTCFAKMQPRQIGVGCRAAVEQPSGGTLRIFLDPSV